MPVKELETIHCSTGRSQTTPSHWPLMTAVKAAVQSLKVTVSALGRCSIAHCSEVVPACTAMRTPAAFKLSTVS